MNSEDKNLRFLLLICIFIIGILCGFIFYLTKEQESPQTKKEANKIQTQTKKEQLVLPDVNMIETQASNFSLPIFDENGYRSSELIAQEVLWNQNGSIELTRPLIYEYDKDGKTIIMRLSGDHGTLDIDNKTKEIKDVRVWGNTRIIRCNKEDKIGSEE